jgi:hypothetical protein
VLDQVLRLIGTEDFPRDADIMTQNAGPLENGESLLLIDPPCHEFGHPAVGVRVAGGANVGSPPAGRAIAADHEEELLHRKKGQFIKTKQSDLRVASYRPWKRAADAKT